MPVAPAGHGAAASPAARPYAPASGGAGQASPPSGASTGVDHHGSLAGFRDRSGEPAVPWRSQFPLLAWLYPLNGGVTRASL